jgi:hypothetical protein
MTRIFVGSVNLFHRLWFAVKNYFFTCNIRREMSTGGGLPDILLSCAYPWSFGYLMISLFNQLVDIVGVKN